MAGASGNHLLYQQTFQPADNLYFRLQEGLQRARYGDFMAALVLHTTVILEQANVLRELVQDSRALYNKVIENTQAVKGLEAKTAAIERQIIEQNLHLRDMPPCQPPSCNIYPAMGEQQVHVMCAREPPRSRADQPPLVSLARMTHSQQQMEEAYQRQTMISRPPSRTPNAYPPPPPPLVPHPSSNSYSFLTSGNYPTPRPYGSVTQPPRLYPIPSNRGQQPSSSTGRYPLHSLSRLQPPAILPPPDSGRPLPVTSQSITISTVITTTASSSSSSTTTASPSSLSSPSESAILPNLVLPAGITIIPLGPVTSSATDNSQQGQQQRRESPIRNLRPSVVIQAIRDESDRLNESERDISRPDLLKRKRRLMPLDTNTMRILRRFGEGDDEGDYSRELLPYDNQAPRALPEIDLVPIKQVPLQISDETIVTPGILQHAQLVQTSLVSTISSRTESDVAPLTIKKISQNKGLNLESLLQRIAEYTQNKPTVDAPSVSSDKNAVATMSVGSRRRKSLTKITRDKIRQNSSRILEGSDSIDEMGIPTCENVFRNSDTDVGIPIIVSVEGSVDVNKFLDENSEEPQSVEEEDDKTQVSTVVHLLSAESSALHNIESNMPSVGTLETDKEVSSIIDEFKSINISPQSEKRLKRNPVIILSRCDDPKPPKPPKPPIGKIRVSLRGIPRVMSSDETRNICGRATPPHDLDSAVTEIVTELVSYIEMRNTCSPAPVEPEAAEKESASGLPVVTSESTGSISSSSSSNVQSKSMGIQHFDVFCVTRDNILKVHNNDYSSTEDLPQVPALSTDSPAASEDSTKSVTLPAKSPTTLEVPEPEVGNVPFDHEVTKPMQVMESLSTSHNIQQQSLQVHSVADTVTVTRAIDTQDTDVSNIIVTSVSSVIDEAFHSPSTPQDYAAKLLAKLKTIIPDIRVTPVTPQLTSETNNVVTQVACNDLIITSTIGEEVLTTLQTENSLEIKNIAPVDSIPLCEIGNVNAIAEHVDQGETNSFSVNAVGSVPTVLTEDTAICDTLGSVEARTENSAVEEMSTVRKVVNKIVRTVAANTGVVCGMATDVLSSGASNDVISAGSSNVVTTCTVEKKSSDVGLTDFTVSSIDSVVSAIVQGISDIIANTATDSSANRTADVKSNAVICKAIDHACSPNLSSICTVAIETGGGASSSGVDSTNECSTISAVTIGDAIKSKQQQAGGDVLKTTVADIANFDEVGIESANPVVMAMGNVDPSAAKSSLQKSGGLPSVGALDSGVQSTPAGSVTVSVGGATKHPPCVPVVKRIKLVRPVHSSASCTTTVPCVTGSVGNVNIVDSMVSAGTLSPNLNIPANQSGELRLSIVAQMSPITHHVAKLNEGEALTSVVPKHSPSVLPLEHVTTPAIVSGCELLSEDRSNIRTDSGKEMNKAATIQNENAIITSPRVVTAMSDMADPSELSGMMDTTETLQDMDTLTIPSGEKDFAAHVLLADESVSEQVENSSLMTPLTDMVEELPVRPSLPHGNSETIQQVILDLISVVSLNSESSSSTLVQQSGDGTPLLCVNDKLPDSQEILMKLQPSTVQNVKQKLPARKPKLNLWGASGYRTRKKRRKARVKPDSLATAAAAADKSVIASLTTDVSEQLKKRRGHTKSTKAVSEKQGTKIGSNTDNVKQPTGKSSQSGPVADRRGSVYLGVTVEGEAEVELRTSSKGRVSLFKVVTRDRKTRRSQLSDKTSTIRDPRKLTSPIISEAEARAALATFTDEVDSSSVGKNKKISGVETANQSLLMPTDTSSSVLTGVLPVPTAANDASIISESDAKILTESTPKRKRGRPRDPNKLPKSKSPKSNSSGSQISRPNSSNVQKCAAIYDQMSQPEKDTGGGEDTKTYRVVQSESLPVLPEKSWHTEQKRLKTLTLTTRMSGTPENVAATDGDKPVSSSSPNCAETGILDKNLDSWPASGTPKTAEDGNSSGALRLVIKRPGVALDLKEHQLETAKKSLRIQRKGSQPKATSKEDKSATPQLLTFVNTQSNIVVQENTLSVFNASTVNTSRDQPGNAIEVSSTSNSAVNSASERGNVVHAVADCRSIAEPFVANPNSQQSEVLADSSNKVIKTRRKTSWSKDDSSDRRKALLPQPSSAATTDVHNTAILSCSSGVAGYTVECPSDTTSFPAANCMSTDILFNEETRLHDLKKTVAKTRRKVVQFNVNSKDNFTVSLPKPSSSATQILQDNEALTAHETSSITDCANVDVLPADNHSEMQETIKLTPKSRRKSAQTNTLSGTGIKSTSLANVPNYLESGDNLDNLLPVHNSSLNEVMQQDVTSVTECNASDDHQAERAKLQDAVRKATTKTRRKISKLRATPGESAKSFAVLPASLSENQGSSNLEVDSDQTLIAEAEMLLSGNMQSSTTAAKEVPPQVSSCSSNSSLDDDIVEVITARVRMMEKGDPDYAIISLLRDLIEGNDSPILPVMSSGCSDLEDEDSAGAMTLTRAINIWQEHDYSRFPIEVLKLSENEQESIHSSGDSHIAATSSLSTNLPPSQPEVCTSDAAEGSRITVARSTIETIINADSRRKTGEELQPPSSIANALRLLLTRVQDQNVSLAGCTASTDNDTESGRNRTVRLPESTAKACSECSSAPSGSKCNHVIAVSASSASRLLSLLTQASRKATNQVNNESLSDSRLSSANPASDTLNAELSALREEDTGDESSASGSSSGQTLNFKQLLQTKLQTKLKVENCPSGDSSDVETDDRYRTLLKTFINKKTVITEKNACYVTPERNLNIKTLKHRLSFAIAGGVSTTTTIEESEESFALQPQVQCVNIFSIHEIWKYLKCFINDSSRASLSLHQLGQKEMQQFLVLAKLCSLSAHKDETDLVFEKTEQTQDLTVDMLEEAVKLLEEGNVE